MDQTPSLQQVLFQQIKARIPDNMSFVHEIAELLEISYDSAYRRIRGEKELSMEELFRLSHRFNISLDTLLGIQSTHVVFNRLAVSPDHINIKSWLGKILDDIRIIHQAGEKEIIYAAKDPPIFHYFQFPEIAAFKTFFWEKTLFGFPEYEDKVFRMDNVDREMIEVGQNILRLATKIPTIEIWNQDTFRMLLRQIEYYLVSGYFEKKDDAALLLDTLDKWLKHIQKEACLGFKFVYGHPAEGIENSFIMYENEVVLNDNTIYVKIKDNVSTYLTFNVISLLVTQDTDFCDIIEKYLRGLLKRSNMISMSGEKERNRFFNKLYRTIEKTRLELDI